MATKSISFSIPLTQSMAENTVNLPDSLYEDYSQLALNSPSSNVASSSTHPPPPPPPLTILPTLTLEMILQWIHDLYNPNILYSNLALQSLVDHRNNVEFLPRLLWESGTVHLMLQEVIWAYRNIALHIPYPYAPQIDPVRVYNILLLFQKIAYHQDTRGSFLRERLPNYFYPLMNIGRTNELQENIRYAALSVITRMLEAHQDGLAVRYVMDTAILTHCEKTLEFGSIHSKTLVVFIINKIMSTVEGLQYCCVLADRFFVIDDILRKMLTSLSYMPKPCPILLKLIVNCYYKLSLKDRACRVLKRDRPVLLFDVTFTRLIADNPETQKFFRQMIQNLET